MEIRVKGTPVVESQQVVSAEAKAADGHLTGKATRETKPTVEEMAAHQR
jgi:hypothetical protein